MSFIETNHSKGYPEFFAKSLSRHMANARYPSLYPPVTTAPLVKVLKNWLQSLNTTLGSRGHD